MPITAAHIKPVLSGFVDGFIDTLAGGFENAPALRKLNLANRVRSQVGLQASYTPLSFLVFSFDCSYTARTTTTSPISA